MQVNVTKAGLKVKLTKNEQQKMRDVCAMCEHLERMGEMENVSVPLKAVIKKHCESDAQSPEAKGAK